MAFSVNNINGLKDSMLSETSKAWKAESRKTEFIEYTKLVPSELNKDFSKSGIEELAEQIYTDGLDQPLVVTQEKDGTYEILAGERRYLAIGKLIDSDRWNDDGLVECKVKHYEESDLPLSREDKKMLTWLTTNQYRAKTDSDIYLEAVRWSELIKKLRAEGINILVAGYDEEGNPIKKSIAGKKTRKLVAEQTNISTGQVGNVEYIESHGTEALKEALKNDKIKIYTATKVAALSDDEQNAVIDQAKKDDTEITEETIKKATTNRAKKTKPAITKKQLKSDISGLNSLVKDFDVSMFDEKSYKAYQKHLNALVKLLTP